jgi:arylsulfatase A-like enzyme
MLPRAPRLCLLALFTLLVAAANAMSAATARKNVLFIISDDLNNLLGCYGDPVARTPNLDRLAARGVRFDRAYCTYPLCGPSRNSMLTGLYPNSTGIVANSQIFRQTIPSQVSLSQAFRQAGYFAGRIGKLYHYNVPNSIGTDGHDDPASWELELNPAGVDRLEDHPKIKTLTPGQFGGTLSWYASPKGDAEHTDGKIAADAEWVLERCARQRDRPFFLAVGFFRPHTPYVAPEKPYFGLFPKNAMRVVQGVKEDQANKPAAALMSYKNEQNQLTDDLRRDALQAYYASISFMDAQVGRVISALDRLGLAESTIVVFTSDHGYHTGEHGLVAETKPLREQRARAAAHRGSGSEQAGHGGADTRQSPRPLPHPRRTRRGQGSRQPPGPEPRSDPGTNVSAKGRGWALTQVMRGGGGGGGKKKAAVGRFAGYSFRTERWRYTEWGEGAQGRELYDYTTDPQELTNLALLPAHAPTVADLSRQLRAAVKTTFPASGTHPTVNDGLWAPLLVAP